MRLMYKGGTLVVKRWFSKRKKQQRMVEQILQNNRHMLYKILYLYVGDEQTALSILEQGKTDCLNAHWSIEQPDLLFRKIVQKHIEYAMKDAPLPATQEPYRAIAYLYFGAQLHDELLSRLLHCDEDALQQMILQVMVNAEGKPQKIQQAYEHIQVPANLT